MNGESAPSWYSNFSKEDLTFQNLKRRGNELVTACRQSRNLVLIVVFIALFFDNMLLTVVGMLVFTQDHFFSYFSFFNLNFILVPIIPDYLYNIEHPNADAEIALLYKQKNLTDLYDTSENLNFTPDPTSRSNSKLLTSTIENLLKEETLTLEKEKWKSIQMNKLSTKVGLLFASKPIVQLVANPFIGPLTNRIGYSIPMFIGFIIMFLSTITFAFGSSYYMLFVARAVQGIGSACSSVAGLGMLADRYPDDEERGHAMGIALGGLAMGVLGKRFGHDFS